MYIGSFQHVYACASERRCPERTEEGIISPGTRDTGICDLLDMSACNQTYLLFNNSHESYGNVNSEIYENAWPGKKCPVGK